MTGVFERIAAGRTFRFFGGVEIDSGLTLADPADAYRTVVIATDDQASANLGIPVKELNEYFSAAEFVGWYNGHPDFAEQPVSLNCEHALVIGNDNIALNLARLLLKPIQQLACTDIASHGETALRVSDMAQGRIRGRCGRAQSSFTYRDPREFRSLPDVARCTNSTWPLSAQSLGQISGNWPHR